MRLEELLRIIDDPFNLEGSAPLGHSMLMAASLGGHFKLHGERVKSFYKYAEESIENEQFDYQIPAAVSVPLAMDNVEFEDSLVRALFARQSVRKFQLRSVAFNSLSFLLKMSAGFKNIHDTKAGRFFPSGGGIYSLRVYVDVRAVEGISPGLYCFNPYRDSLDLVNSDVTDQLRYELHNKGAEMDQIKNIPFQILISTKPSATLRKYGEHGWKIILMEMGHLAQNLWLVGLGCGLAGYPCTSLNMSVSEKFLRSSTKGEFLLYSFLFGFPHDET